LSRDELFGLILRNSQTYYKQAGLTYISNHFPLRISNEISPIENTVNSFLKLPQKPEPLPKEAEELISLLNIWG